MREIMQPTFRKGNSFVQNCQKCMLFAYDILNFGQMEYLSHLTYYRLLNFFFFIEVQLLYNVVLVSTAQRSAISHMGISIASLGNLPPLNPIPLGHHRAPSGAPCAIEQLPTNHLFHTRQCIYVGALLPVLPTLPFL